MPIGHIDEIAERWLISLSGTEPGIAAADLYTGRSFKYAKEAAACLSADLGILSAGLGYVDGARAIPSYNLAVGPGPASIAQHVHDFDPRRWWDRIASGRYSSDPLAAIEHRPIILLALTKDYARMAGRLLDSLAARPDGVRVFGAGAASYVPGALVRCVMPYDQRMSPRGTRGDFAGRALLAHARLLTKRPSPLCLEQEREEVVIAMARGKAPDIAARTKTSDAAIAREIKPWLQVEPRISRTRLVRRLRDQCGIACSDARAARIAEALIA
ncbi:hypothetical protein ASE95_08590 [Sphingomonas sp. Leaf231]|nr:hypothetical protein ASE95_08590 [Sphingomonas sp. Leaf231]